MHENIIEHTSRDSGYNAGVEAGKKRAWDLLQEAADWYKVQIQREEDRGRLSDSCYIARLETVLYAQQIIRRDSI
jgi:hypothetical protein